MPEATGRIMWRESVMCWPSVRVQVELCPWQWGFSWWSDRPETTSGSLLVGPLKVEWWTNREWFPVERTSEVCDA